MGYPTALEARRSEPKPDGDIRSPFKRDRDRIFYAAEFGRLEGVTQVVTVLSVALHNRLTHSYRVEQVARSIAEKLQSDGVVDVDQDVVAAAALAHDIGHPPFGHTGEVALQKAVTCEEHQLSRNSTDWKGRQPRRPRGNHLELACADCKLVDGFEGNAQSLRVLGRLAAKVGPDGVWRPDGYGLDVTRRSLRAATKYPWSKGGNKRKPAKWGAYDCDLDLLRWVNGTRQSAGSSPDAKSVPLEAQIMDAADDIAYAVHDLEDFFKIGVVPLHEIRIDKSASTSRLFDYIRNERAEINYDPLQDLLREWQDIPQISPQVPINPATYPNLAYLDDLISGFPSERYIDDVEGRAALTQFRSSLISHLIGGLGVDNKGDLNYTSTKDRIFVEFLKQLAWYYVIDDPQLNAIRVGQEAIVKECFNILYNTAHALWVSVDVTSKKQELLNPTPHQLRSLPIRLAAYVQIGIASPGRYFPSEIVARGVVDYICSLTDTDLYSLSSQLRGLPSHATPGIAAV